MGEEVEVEGKKEGLRAISHQKPKLLINCGQKCPKTYPKLTEVQSPEVLTPGNFLSLDVTHTCAITNFQFKQIFK
jgi:hypothetical protein